MTFDPRVALWMREGQQEAEAIIRALGTDDEPDCECICYFCGAINGSAIGSYGRQSHDHTPSCLWVRARRLMGLPTKEQS